MARQGSWIKSFSLPLFEDWIGYKVLDPSPIEVSAEKWKPYLDDEVLREMEEEAKLGGSVEIDDKAMTIHVVRADGEVFDLDGSNYDEVMSEIPHGISPNNYILWLSNKW